MKIIIKFLILIILISCNSTKSIQSDYEKTEIKYDSGEIKSQGYFSKNYLPYYKLRIGKWVEFYKTGNIKSEGFYEIGKYEECCTGGVCEEYYNYKSSNWTFFYDNGQIKAEGPFEINEFHLTTSCEGGETIAFGIVDSEKWNFYNIKGDKIKPTKTTIEEIEKTKTNGGFPNSTFKADKGTKNIIREQ